MLKKISCALLCAGALFSTVASAEVHTLAPGLTIDYEFPPNIPQVFTNYMFWTIEASCKIQTADEVDELFAKALKKRGSVNGKNLSEGQSMSVLVSSNTILTISAETGAQVEITNKGKSVVTASCTV